MAFEPEGTMIHLQEFSSHSYRETNESSSNQCLQIEIKIVLI